MSSRRNIRVRLALLLLAAQAVGGCVAWRAARSGAPAPEDQDRIFAGRAVTRADAPFVFHRAVRERTDLDTITVRSSDGRWVTWQKYMEAGRVRAFLVIRNDTILYERYRDGYTERTLSGSYSMAKSFTAALLGIALDRGEVTSLDADVVSFVPEFRRNASYEGVTLRHALEMRTGFSYARATGRLRGDIRSDDARFYYTSDLYGALQGMRRTEPPGGAWSYRDSDTQILGLALTRATGLALAEQLEQRIWRRIGTEHDATWSLDRRGGMEKAAAGVNATARDYARFGRLFLRGGNWQGEQLVAADWVHESTTLDSTRTQPEVHTWWRMQHRQQWWIPMHEWSLHRDFFADGAKGQRLYVHRASNTVIVQLADGDRHDFPFRRITHYLLGTPYEYPLARAEQPDIAGFFEGWARSAAIGTVDVSANIAGSSPGSAGTLLTPFGDFPLTVRSVTARSALLHFVAGDGEVGRITLEEAGDSLSGTFLLEGDTGVIALHRTGPARELSGPAQGARLDIGLAAWQEDLRFLAEELPQRHGDAFHTIDRATFEDSVAALSQRLHSLADHEIVSAFARLVAQIGDGHTYLELPESLRRYPLRLRLFGDTFRVTAAAPEHAEILGSTVLAIDGTPIDEAYRRMRRLMAEENEQYVVNNTPWMMGYAELLHAEGLVDQMERAEWRFMTPAGELSTTLEPVPAGAAPRLLSARRQLPLALQRPGEPLWAEMLDEGPTLYVNVSGYPARPEFRAFFDSVFDIIDRHSVQRLVIDLRENRGGDFTKARQLLLPRLQDHRLNDPERLFVLIGRATFSAAMTNAADFRTTTRATLVGEPTGARPNGWQEKGTFLLPNSNLTISVSTQYYRFMDADVDAVLPHVHIPITFDAFQAGADPVLEWVLRARL